MPPDSIFRNPSAGAAERRSAYVTGVLALVEGHDPMAVLRETPGVLEEVVATMEPDALGVREGENKWSVAIVLQHLADSELVWGWRLRVVLAEDRPPLTGYDQDRWVDRLLYAKCDPADALQMFSVLRRSHLCLLDNIGPEDRQRVGVHAERGEESVEHMIRLYAGHDLVHRRQIDRIRRAVS